MLILWSSWCASQRRRPFRQAWALALRSGLNSCRKPAGPGYRVRQIGGRHCDRLEHDMVILVQNVVYSFVSILYYYSLSQISHILAMRMKPTDDISRRKRKTSARRNPEALPVPETRSLQWFLILPFTEAAGRRWRALLPQWNQPTKRLQQLLALFTATYCSLKCIFRINFYG